MIDANMLIGVVMVFLQFFVLTSVVMMFSVVFTPTVNFFLGLGVYIVGLMSSTSLTLFRSPDASIFVKVLLLVYVSRVSPFDKFNVTNALLYPDAAVGNIWVYTGWMMLKGTAFSLGAMVLAVLLFWRKEV